MEQKRIVKVRLLSATKATDKEFDYCLVVPDNSQMDLRKTLLTN